MLENERFAPKFDYQCAEFDLEAIKAEMEDKGFSWDQVEASIDYLSRPDEIAKKMGMFFELDPNEDERLESAIEQIVEGHIKAYTAGTNVEPIGVYRHVSHSVSQFVATKIREQLTFGNL